MIVSGTSYAILTLVLEGTSENVVRTGSLAMTLTESNSISLSSVVPISDEEGLLGTSFSFSVENTGDIEAGYKIYLEDLALEVGENRFPNTDIRYELRMNDQRYGLTNLELNNTEIYVGNINPLETVEFELRLWIDYDVTYIEPNSVHRSKIRIEATQELAYTPESCFEFSNNTITNYKGGCPKNVVIPPTINGEDVLTIGEFSFAPVILDAETGDLVEKPSRVLITSIVIPDSVVAIGDYSFISSFDAWKFPSHLTYVKFGKSVESIGLAAFFDNQIVDLVIPDNVVTIDPYAFYSNQISSLALGSGVSTIDSYVFGDNQIVNLVIPDNVTVIKEFAFSFNQINNIVIPDSVTSIGVRAFSDNPIFTISLPNTLVDYRHILGVSSLCDESSDSIIVRGIHNYDITAICME